MPHVHCIAAARLNIGIDARKPFLNPGKIFDPRRHRRKIVFGNTHVFILVQRFHHETHVYQHRIRAGVDRLLVHLSPKCFRLNADFRQHRVFLHRLRRERAVEVVDHRDGVLRKRFFDHGESLAGIENARSCRAFPLWPELGGRFRCGPDSTGVLVFNFRSEKSVRVNPGLLDDRPPLGDFGGQVCA